MITRILSVGKDIEGLLSQPPSVTCYINVKHPKAICHAWKICNILTRFIASQSKWMSPQRPDDWPFPNSPCDICQGLAGMVKYGGNIFPSLSNPDATTEQPCTKHWHPQHSGKDPYLNCFTFFRTLESDKKVSLKFPNRAVWHSSELFKYTDSYTSYKIGLTGASLAPLWKIISLWRSSKGEKEEHMLYFEQ